MLASLPLLALAGLALLQAGLIGYAAWTAADGARAAARAGYVGADPEGAANGAVPIAALVGDVDVDVAEGIASVAVTPLRLPPFSGALGRFRLHASTALVVPAGVSSSAVGEPDG